MNSKGHFYISLTKSWLRILGCIFAIPQCLTIIDSFENKMCIPMVIEESIFRIAYVLIVMAVFFLIAELLGIVEEIFDKRD